MNRAIFPLLSILILSNMVWVFGQKTVNQAESDWRKGIKSDADGCRHHMSKETASYFDDDEEYDNEEVRKFLVCLYTSLSYMKDGKMQARPIHHDANKYFHGTGQNTIDAVNDAIDFCAKHEVDDDDSEVDTAGKFTNCLNKKKKNDIEE